MSILFSASEVGSVRALLPICYELLRLGQTFLIDRHGYFAEIDDPVLSHCFVEIPDATTEIEQFMRKTAAGALIFSVNVHDTRPLKIARIARSMDMCTLHVLDYWNGYRSKLCVKSENIAIDPPPNLLTIFRIT